LDLRFRLDPQLWKNVFTEIAYFECLKKIIFSREYRIAKEPLALGCNSSMNPWYQLTLAVPPKKS